MTFLYCPPALRDILLTSVHAQYSLLVLKVQLNTKQTKKLSIHSSSLLLPSLPPFYHPFLSPSLSLATWVCVCVCLCTYVPVLCRINKKVVD